MYILNICAKREKLVLNNKHIFLLNIENHFKCNDIRVFDISNKNSQ